ncbi:hypothetical protein [Acetomicrobium sp.]
MSDKKILQSLVQAFSILELMMSVASSGLLKLAKSFLEKKNDISAPFLL